MILHICYTSILQFIQNHRVDMHFLNDVHEMNTRRSDYVHLHDSA